MYLGFCSFYWRQFKQNKMFESAAVGIGDDLNYPALHLKKRLNELGHKVATIDMEENLEKFDAVVFIDYPLAKNFYPPELRPYFRKLKRTNIPLYLVICESPSVHPDGWKRAHHAPFRKVFTWSPKLADGQKYIRMRMPFKLPEFAPYTPSRAEKFCCLIASQKYSWVREELYSERVRAIRWFERNHPDEFDLYGQRWDRFFFQKQWSILNPVLNMVYNRCSWLPRRRIFPSARGAVTSKRDILRRYKFSICYENASYPGWLTEKVLDAMFAGCVPVYLGDPEVAEFVPAEAFIDKRAFPDYDSLYRFLKGMTPAQYEGYREAIHHFVHGEAIKPMGPEAFTQLILREVIDDPGPA
jgi:alpha(1,3/1,4) fucosyltransferase